ncbi:unnamed protein product [Schistocephalus solidus]|uniref:Cadherin domain protein n=1 Tax=Schistocephalus solidus TaxID=70667 RepID=A0A183SKF1_SCHSO|nr:unnamed protein product [Schistocephalus solidus]
MYLHIWPSGLVILLVGGTFVVNSEGESSPQRFWVKENTAAGTIIGQITRRPGSSLGSLTFTNLADKRIGAFFSVLASNGSIVTLRQIDREEICSQPSQIHLSPTADNSNIFFSPYQENTPFCDVGFIVHVSVEADETRSDAESYLETVSLGITDENDNPPIFTPNVITLKISESSPIQSQFPLPSATDADLGVNGVSHYRLNRLHHEVGQMPPKTCPPPSSGPQAPKSAYMPDSESSVFALMSDANEEMDEGRTNKVPKLLQVGGLDYEQLRTLYYCLTAFDGGGLEGSLLIIIEVQDANDNAPAWVGLPYRVSITECGEERHQTPPALWKASLDARNYARSQGFDYDASLRFVTQLLAVDADSEVYGQVHYKTPDENPRKSHSKGGKGVNTAASTAYKSIIHSDKLFLIGHLDYETAQRISIPVEAFDGGGLSNFTEIEIVIEDCNDNVPQISIQSLSPAPPEVGNAIAAQALPAKQTPRQLNIWFYEEEMAEVKLATVTVSDADSEQNANINCDVEWNSAISVNPFKLVPLRGARLPPGSGYKVPKVYLLSKRRGVKLDRETTPRVQVTIVCTDGGYPEINVARSLVEIGILDINDNAPEFQNKHAWNAYFAVPENEPQGTFAGVVRATDADFGTNAAVSYSLAPCPGENGTLPFTIEASSGNVYTTQPLDREYHSTYFFVNNYNASGCIVFEMSETFENEQVLNNFLGQINATDADDGANSSLFFSLKPSQAQSDTGGRATFRITRKGQLFVNGILDREATEEYELIVVASDSAPPRHRLSAEITVKVRVLDINDNSPVFTEPATPGDHLSVIAVANVTLQTAVNSTIYRACARDPDIGNNSLLNFTLRCAKYLKPFFNVTVPAKQEEGDATCVHIVLTKPLFHLISSAAVTLSSELDASQMEALSRQIKFPIEHQLYVIVSDSGQRQFTKTARLRVVIRRSENMEVGSSFGREEVSSKRSDMEATLRSPHLDSVKANVGAPGTLFLQRHQQQPLTYHPSEEGLASDLLGKAGISPKHAADPSSLSSSKEISETTAASHMKAKHLFIIAVVIFIMFIGILGLLAFILLRDFSQKRTAPCRGGRVSSGGTEITNSQKGTEVECTTYPDFRPSPLTYLPELVDGKLIEPIFSFLLLNN